MISKIQAPSLAGLLMAVMMFAATLAMHEASRAEPSSRTLAPVAMKLLGLADFSRR
ncbi:MAG TPA: hypothetical protein VLB11_05880 [Methyloceanibacter sp.]|nr:hypothetical protein [Methyloceanibacter sp.]